MPNNHDTAAEGVAAGLVEQLGDAADGLIPPVGREWPAHERKAARIVARMVLREAATTITRLTAENARQAAEIEGLRAFANDALKFAELVKDVGVWSEGIHSGLRKGTDAPSAGKLWNAIAASRDSAWQDAIRFAIDPFFSLWGGNKLIDAARALTGGHPHD